MTDQPRLLGDIAALVRAKNAGPFWLTLDVFFADHASYEQVTASGAVSAESVAAAYRVPAATVQVFHLPAINVIKASLPRPVVQGSFADRDMHSGQQHIPLARLPVTS